MMAKSTKIFGGVALLLAAIFGLSATRAEKKTESTGTDVPGGLICELEIRHAYGHAVIDEGGVSYQLCGFDIHEDFVFPPEYWGVYPLFILGTRIEADISLANESTITDHEIRLVCEAFRVRDDGSAGPSLMSPRTKKIILSRGESRRIEMPFTVYESPGDGISVFTVSAEKTPTDPSGATGPICSRMGVFCPAPSEELVLELLSEILRE